MNTPAATRGVSPSAAMIEGMARIGIDLTHVYGLTEVYGPASVCVKRPSALSPTAMRSVPA